MKIGIDIDEVIVEFVEEYLEIYNNRYNQNKTVKEIDTYNLWIPLGISREEAFNITDEFYASKNFDNISLVKGAYERICQLGKKHDLFFITSRPESIKDKTENFFKINFPNLNYQLIFSGDLFPGQEKTKANICERLGIEVIIEDNIDYANNCAKIGIIAYLLNKPWNQNGSLPKNIVRVKDWDEILEKIK